MPSALGEPRRMRVIPRLRILGGLLVVLLVVHASLAEGDEPPAIPGPSSIGARLPRVLPAAAVLVDTPGSGATKPTASRAAKSRSRNRRPRLRLAAATSLTLGCGAVAWWTRERADRAYERYLDAAGPRRQAREFARAERYDRLSGTALLGMEAGLLLTTYWLFY